jgi:hypothetical protein
VVSPLDFFTAGADGHAAQAGNFAHELHAPAPKLEREQTGEPAAALLIEVRHDPIDGLMLTGHSTVRMCFASGALALMGSTLRFWSAHGSGTTLDDVPARWWRLSLHQNGQVIL